MRFGCFVPQGWRLDLVGIETEAHWPAMLSVASGIEAAGYESLWVYDHFHTTPVSTQEATYEAWTLMSALAAATTTVRLGQMCTCVAYRPPAYLAKVAATIDVISGGRVEMGIGAGWSDGEYLGYGYEFPKPSLRIGMLREGVEIMRRMWTEDVVDYQGKYYTLHGGINRPRPVQNPSIPMWIAGGGEQLTLRITAEYADYANFGGSVAAFSHKSSVLQNHCRDVGTDFERIVRSTNMNVVCAKSETEVEDRISWIKERYAAIIGEEEAAQRGEAFRAMAGTPDQLIEKLRPWADAGLSYAILYFAEAAFDTSGLELFASEVMPALV